MKRSVQALFVHGMWRSPLSAWPLLRRLRTAGGWETSTFGYSVVVSDAAEIQTRLAQRIALLTAAGDTVLIGHSLGGVLLRLALNALPPGTALPRRLFLLGSPVRASRYAQIMGRRAAFRALTGDCGRMLAAPERMNAIGPAPVPTTAIVGTRSLPFGVSPFGDLPNDGIVSVEEAHAEWIDERVELPMVHTVLPSLPRVADVVLTRTHSPPPDRRAGHVV